MRGYTLLVAVAALACGEVSPGDVATGARALAAEESAAGTFRPAGNLVQPRKSHAAARLPDGRVLIVGGQLQGAYDWTRSAELYDPARDVFEAVASTLWAHDQPEATVLNDGRVLITGTVYSEGLPAGKSEFFDPLTGSFTPGPEGALRDHSHTATLLADGRVLVSGTTAEVYDPSLDAFTPAGAVKVQLGSGLGRAAVRLSDGRVLLSGGGAPSSGGGQHAAAELFDPAANAFALTASMAEGRGWHALTALADGRVLVTGGFQSYGGLRIGYPDPELFDPASATFERTGATRSILSRHTATRLASGAVLLVGTSGREAELYDPADGAFAITAAPLASRSEHTATLLDDGRVLIAGGAPANHPHTAEVFEPAR